MSPSPQLVISKEAYPDLKSKLLRWELIALVINELNWFLGKNAKDPLLDFDVGVLKELHHRVYATLAVGRIPAVRSLRNPLFPVCCTISVTTAPVCIVVSMPLTMATSTTSIVSITAIRTNRKGSGRGLILALNERTSGTVRVRMCCTVRMAATSTPIHLAKVQTTSKALGKPKSPKGLARDCNDITCQTVKKTLC